MKTCTRKMFYVVCAIAFLLTKSSMLTSQISFDNLNSTTSKQMDRKVLVDNLRQAINGSSSDLERNIASRYPEFLNLAAQTMSQSNDSEKVICARALSRFIKAFDQCPPESITPNSSCYSGNWQKQFETFSSQQAICERNKKNATQTKKRLLPKGIPALYLMVAVKIVARAAVIFNERRCKQMGGMYHDGNICLASSGSRSADRNTSRNESRSGFEMLIIGRENSKNPLTKISLAGNITTLLCLILLILTYIALQKHRTVPGKTTICLSVCLICASVFQIIIPYFSEIKTFCITAGAFLHWFLLASFFWMSSLAYEYFIGFHQIRLVSHAAKMVRFKAYCGVSFLAPTIALLVCLLLDISDGAITQYGANERCFIVGFWTNLFAFVVPVAIILSINIGLLVFTIRDLHQRKKAAQHITNSTNRKNVVLTLVALKMSVILGVAWLMAFVDGIVSNIVVRYIYVIVVTFQGLFIYIAFGNIHAVCYRIRNKICNRTEDSSVIPTKETKM